jgi:hypothetical protein
MILFFSIFVEVFDKIHFCTKLFFSCSDIRFNDLFIIEYNIVLSLLIPSLRSFFETFGEIHSSTNFKFV